MYAIVCGGSSRLRGKIKEGAEGQKMGRGQQMPQVTRSPKGSQLNKPASKHSKQTPANIVSQMRTFIKSTHTLCVIYIPLYA